MIPSTVYDKTLSKGDKGHSVWALQINLEADGHEIGPSGADGTFGHDTVVAVRSLQRAANIRVDGVAGIITQRKLAIRLMRAPRKIHNIPYGLDHGFVEGESGWAVGAVAAHPESNSMDCGWGQQNITDGSSEQRYFEAFYGPEAFDYLNERLRKAKNRYEKYEAVGTDELAWWIAILDYNWQAAAKQYALGIIDDWVYTSDDKEYTMSDPAPWVQEASGGRLSTGYEWAEFYVQSKSKYVEDWTP